jgi:hypothetical protein
MYKKCLLEHKLSNALFVTFIPGIISKQFVYCVSTKSVTSCRAYREFSAHILPKISQRTLNSI